MGTVESVVSRDDHLRRLDEVLAGLDATVPTGRVVLLEGPAGIGKTTLADVARRASAERGHEVLVGRGTELGAHLPNAPLIDAFGEGPAIEGDVDGRIDVLQRQWQLIDRLTVRLETLASRRPVLLVLEDLHHADDDTLIVLGRLAPLVQQLPLAVILTTRREPTGPARAALVRQLVDDGALHLPLDPLSPAAVQRLAEHRLGRPPGAALNDVLAHAGGNPLYVVELLDALRDEGRLTDQNGVAEAVGSGLPPSLGLTIVRRLGALAEPTLRCLRLAAVLGDQVAVHTLAQQAGSTTADVIGLLDPAIRAGLLESRTDTVCFRHDLIRQALYDDTPALQRAALHAAAADGLAAAAADPAAIAFHRAKGLVKGDDGAALDLLDRCGPLLEWAPAAVQSYAEAARAVLPVGHPGRLRASCLAADAAARMGEPERAEAVVRSLDDDRTDPDVRLGLWRTITVSRLLRGKADPEGLRDHQRLAEQVEADPGQTSRHLALIAYGWFLTQTPEGYGRAAALAEAALEGADDEASRVWGLAVRSLSAPAIPVNRAAARSALLRSRSAGLEHSWAGIVAHAVFADAHATDASATDEVRTVLADALDAAERAGLVHVLPVLHYTAAKAAMHAGDFEEGRVQAETVLGFDAAHGYRELAPNAAHILAHIAMTRGDEPPDLGPCPPIFATLLDLNRAARLLAAGDPSQAHALIGPAVLALPQLPPQIALPWYHPVLEGLAAAGDRPVLDGIINALEAYVEEWGDEIGLATLAFARVVADPTPESARQAMAAASRATPIPWQLEAARVAGTVFADHDLPEEAEAAFALASGIADRAGATRLSAEIARRSAPTAAPSRGPRPRHGWDAITEAEGRVLALVVEGLTYRAAGERLFVSRRTVETHVASIFNKLGVRSRHELLHRWMQRTAESP